MNPSCSEIRAQAKKNFDDIVSIRRDIHMHPETGFDVQRTAGIAAEEMERLGLPFKTGVGGTGIIADIDIPGCTRRIALRADMDALVMSEQTDLEYRSTVDGKAHMCGHDAHTAMLIGAARIINHLRDHLKVNVRFIFQPNEESLPGGAIAMIEDGAIDGVDQIYGLHVLPALEVGTIGLRTGAFLGQPDSFEITILGKGGHGAMPHYAVDPIYVGSLLVTSLQSIVSRNVDPFDPAVVSITQFHGGTSDNIIPDQVTIVGTVRTLDKSVQKSIKEKIELQLKGVTTAHGATFRYKYTEGYPVTMNNETCVQKVLDISEELLGEENIVYPYPAVLGGEDFGYYCQKIPAAFAFIGCGNKKKGIVNMCHNPLFAIDENCLLHGMAIHTAIVFGC